jgi:starch-binding outer membrane protein SusE/F
MKIWLNKICLFGIFTLALFACEKDEDKVIVKQGSAPALTASSTSLVLNKDAANNEAVNFSWTPSNYGFSAAVKYVLQMAKKGTDFATPRNIDLGSSLQKKYTVAELNSALSLMEFAPGTAGEVELRVRSEISPSIAPVYSNVLTISATPYLDIIEYPSVYVPGGYQGWAPDKAAKLSSVKDDKTYEGYINFTDATTEFKITPAPNWDTDYGDEGDGTTGKLKVKGNNLKVTGAGYYLFKVDLNALTWSKTKTDWGIIGSATANGWDSDQNMTYDATAQVWKATLTLKEGEIKFRANDAWDINLGDNKPANGLLTYGGENIKIAEDGQYEITLSLGIPGNYTYTVKKL